jgi:hypothetical protein
MNRWGDNEEEDGDGDKDSEGLGEVLWSFHLGDESREEDLRNPEESNIQDGVHATNPGGAGEREGIGSDWSVGRVVAVVPIERSVLDTGKDEEEEDGHGHAGS